MPSQKSFAESYTNPTAAAPDRVYIYEGARVTRGRLGTAHLRGCRRVWWATFPSRPRLQQAHPYRGAPSLSSAAAPRARRLRSRSVRSPETCRQDPAPLPPGPRSPPPASLPKTHARHQDLFLEMWPASSPSIRAGLPGASVGSFLQQAGWAGSPWLHRLYGRQQP